MIWRHYKVGLYRIICMAYDASGYDGLKFVVYENIHTGSRWFRPMKEFFGLVRDGNSMICRFKAQTKIETPVILK